MSGLESVLAQHYRDKVNRWIGPSASQTRTAGFAGTDPIPYKDSGIPRFERGSKEAHEIRQLLAKKYQTENFQILGRAMHPLSKVASEWARGGPHPSFRRLMPAVLFEEMNVHRRWILNIWVQFAILYFWVTPNYHMWAHHRFEDFGGYRVGNYTGWGTDGSLRCVRRAAVRGLGDWVGNGDLQQMRRGLVDKEDQMFRGNLAREKPSYAPFTSMDREQVEAAGWLWDPSIDTEFESAKAILKEYDEAKAVGGKIARADFIAHYKQHIADGKPLPRVWYNVINDWPKHKHATLLFDDEKPWSQALPRSFAPAFQPEEHYHRPHASGAH